MRIITKIRIVWLKRVARCATVEYYAVLDEFGCGHAIAQVTSGRAFLLARKADIALDKLALIDPTTPKERLTIKQ